MSAKATSRCRVPETDFVLGDLYRHPGEWGRALECVWSLCMDRLKRIAPFLALGPISGPLVAGITRNFREGRPFLGSLYAILLIQYSSFLPMLALNMGIKLM